MDAAHESTRIPVKTNPGAVQTPDHRDASSPWPKHQIAYLGKMTWRFNLRTSGEGDRVNALLAQTAGRLTYKMLKA